LGNSETDSELVLVSACLAGYPCRYDGQSQTDERVVRLVREGRDIPVCPDQLGGVTTPRQPSEIQMGDDGEVRVVTIDGEDVTAAFLRGAETTLSIARRYGARRAVLKQNSPSCGVGRVYDGTFTGTLNDGNGVSAQLLADHGIDVRSEDRI